MLCAVISVEHFNKFGFYDSQMCV